MDMELRLRLFPGQLNHVHLVQLFLARHRHISGRHPGLVSGSEILKLGNLLLLFLVGSLQLGFFHLIYFLEFVIIPDIPVEALILHMVNNIDYTV